MRLLCNAVVRWMTFSTLVAMSCTSQSLRDNVHAEASRLFRKASAAATSWNAFLIEASTIYKLGRLLGHRPSVPYTFIRHLCTAHLTDFMTDIPIDAPALELIYFE
jgi:hypothetical protein